MGGSDGRGEDWPPGFICNAKKYEDASFWQWLDIQASNSAAQSFNKDSDGLDIQREWQLIEFQTQVQEFKETETEGDQDGAG